MDDNFLKPQIFFHLIENFELDAFLSLIKSKKSLYKIYQSDSDIPRLLLKKYNVDYENPNSLIYVHTSTSIDNYLKNGIYDYYGLIKLFLKIFLKHSLVIYSPYKIIPTLPNLKSLTCLNKVDNWSELSNLEEFTYKLINMTDINMPVCPKLKTLIIKNINTDIPCYPKLEIFRSENSIIKSLQSCKNVKIISLHQTFLKDIPDFTELEYLDCHNMNLTKLPYCPKLKYLDCSNNKINHLQDYPQLKTLYCNDNLLDNIPYYKHLQILNCSNNDIGKLESMPEIIHLKASNCSLTFLPDFPNIKVLNCEQNYILTIPEYPKLHYLNCSHNPISEIVYDYPHLAIIICIGTFNILKVKRILSIYSEAQFDDYSFDIYTFYEKDFKLRLDFYKNIDIDYEISNNWNYIEMYAPDIELVVSDFDTDSDSD